MISTPIMPPIPGFALRANRKTPMNPSAEP